MVIISRVLRCVQRSQGGRAPLGLNFLSFKITVAGFLSQYSARTVGTGEISEGDAKNA
jgi:hypothetical protein